MHTGLIPRIQDNSSRSLVLSCDKLKSCSTPSRMTPKQATSSLMTMVMSMLETTETIHDNTRTPLIAWGKGVCGDSYSQPWGLSTVLKGMLNKSILPLLMAALLGVWPSSRSSSGC
ncbi:hypothetical protein M378DRAFT_570246 [Amanita muscaria Koide BX008]|uniref:Uncharacterized protein n=1 Tax=Amanita muscaria (strain Koide BX008) TaxID=946122 RepID=A0A0C2RZC1_AMAMK|nr:hypothetical protein M378DRAFT_570246 [Amanita muscaria Koide BX008]